jgi:hypothetical protein
MSKLCLTINFSGHGKMDILMKYLETVFLTTYGPCIVINLRNKNQRDVFSFLKFIPINVLYMFRIDKLSILRRQFTVQAVYGIYRASTLTSC